MPADLGLGFTSLAMQGPPQELQAGTKGVSEAEKPIGPMPDGRTPTLNDSARNLDVEAQALPTGRGARWICAE